MGENSILLHTDLGPIQQSSELWIAVRLSPSATETDEEWLQLMCCATLNSQFLVSRDGDPRVWTEIQGCATSKASVISNDKQGGREMDATLASVPEDRGMQSRYSN